MFNVLKFVNADGTVFRDVKLKQCFIGHCFHNNCGLVEIVEMTNPVESIYKRLYFEVEEVILDYSGK